MAAWKSLLDKAIAMIREPTRFVCTVCGAKVHEAEVCPCCGVVACMSCHGEDGGCPYCGEPM